jgi:electron transfer flavoprotein beta subunit
MATEGLKMSINPFDEIAVEAAVRLRDAGSFTHGVLVTIGPVEAEQQLRTGLAMGADRAIRVDAPAALEPLTVARALHAVAAREQAGLVLLGKQAVDDDHGQTGQMLAALWDRPQATFASAIAVAGNVATVTREIDAGLETLEVDLPAVVTTDFAVESTALREAARDSQSQKQAARRVGSPSSASSRGGSSPSTASRRRRHSGRRARQDVAELLAVLDARGVLA